MKKPAISKRGARKVATPAEIAVYGKIASVLRSELAKRGWDIGDLNENLGFPRGHSVPYAWVAGRGAPNPSSREKLVKLLGIQEELLMPATAKALAVAAPPSAPAVLSSPTDRRSGETLLFSVDRQGQARIKVDIVMPLEQATPLLRMLLDAGVIFGPSTIGD